MNIEPNNWRKNNPEKRYEQKRREKVRIALRKRGILPPPGEELTEEQKLINEQISNNDFSYWDSIKSLPYNKGGFEKHAKNKPLEYYIWFEAKQQSKLLNFDFDLEVDDILIPDVCPYLGTTINKEINEDTDLNNYVLDRIDTSKGFVKGNIHVISKMASIMKNEATPEILVTFASNVIKIHSSEYK